MRRGLVAALPLAVALIYLGVQAQNRIAVNRRVEARTAEGRDVLERARAVAGASVRAREQSFALYREAKVAEAEASWARARSQGTEAERGLVDAARLYEVALAQDPSRDDVRNRLGEVLYERALLAERDGRQAQRDELLQRLRLYDPQGTWMGLWGQPMRLGLVTRPPGAHVRVARYEDRDGLRVAGEPRAIGATPLRGFELAPGSYLLTIEADGRYPVRYPIRALRGTTEQVELDLPPATAVPKGFVYVPPGEFLFGTAADEDVRRGFLAATPIHERSTGGYLIGIHEVTYADWIAYLEDSDAEERARRELRIEASVTGKSGLQLRRSADGVWTLEYGPAGQEHVARQGERIRYPTRTRRVEQDWSRMPVTGVTAFDAGAYAGWLDRSGRLPGARLCTEEEWERAGRGAGSRVFPSGDVLSPDDANFDETYGKDQAAMGPDQVGSYPRSNSPFGLADMSGNAFEWTTSVLAQGGYVARGGSYFYDMKSAQVVNRAESIPTLRDVSLGFRVCAPLTAAP
jgi:formylglycine-generating enzyme required for sulfatase activity